MRPESPLQRSEVSAKAYNSRCWPTWQQCFRKAVYVHCSLGFGWKDYFSSGILLSYQAAAGPDEPLLEGSQTSSPRGGRALLSVVGGIVLAGFQAVSLTAELPGRLACRLFC